MDEINRLYVENKFLPRNIIGYLVGVKDFYKIVSHDAKCLTTIHPFNLYGTLNKPGKMKHSLISVPVVKLPSKIVAFEFKQNSDNTIEMYLNNGWQLSFRIHNASTIVEPSLKFDIRFIGIPPSILAFECRWDRRMI